MKKILLKRLLISQSLVLSILGAIWITDMEIALCVTLITCAVSCVLYLHHRQMLSDSYSMDVIEFLSNSLLMHMPILGIYWFFYNPRWYRDAQIRYRDLLKNKILYAAKNTPKNSDTFNLDCILKNIEMLEALKVDTISIFFLLLIYEESVTSHMDEQGKLLIQIDKDLQRITRINKSVSPREYLINENRLIKKTGTIKDILNAYMKEFEKHLDEFQNAEHILKETRKLIAKYQQTQSVQEHLSRIIQLISKECSQNN